MRNIIRTLTLATGLVAGLFSAGAQAAVVTFESKPAFNCPGFSETDGGMSFGGFACYYSATSPADFPFTPTSTVMGATSAFGGLVSFQRTDGQAFFLDSIDMALAVYTSAGTPITVTGTLSGGGTVQQVVNPTNASFATYDFNWNDLTSVAFTGGFVYVGLDNIVYTDAVVAAVPEPGSLALLGLGLVGLVAARKRKQA